MNNTMYIHNYIDVYMPTNLSKTANIPSFNVYEINVSHASTNELNVILKLFSYPE